MQPPAILRICQCPQKSPSLSRGDVRSTVRNQSLLCTAVCAVSSATGVRNKVRFLHGHHKFPNALQLITHAGGSRRRGRRRRRGEGAVRVSSKVFTRRGTRASLSRSDTDREREQSETKELQKFTLFLSACSVTTLLCSGLMWKLHGCPPVEREGGRDRRRGESCFTQEQRDREGVSLRRPP